MSNPLPPAGSDPAPHRRSHALMHMLMFGTTFCWAVNIIAVKEALTGFHSFALTQISITLAGIIFIVLFLFTGKFRNLKLARRDWVFMIFTGVTGVALNQLCFVAGLEYSSASHAGLIVALGPVMVLVLSSTIGLEPLTIPKFVGMLVAFGGVAILTTAKGGAGHHKALMGDLILLAGTALFAAYTIMVKEVADKCDALTINTLAYLVGVPLLAPVTIPAVLEVHWGEIPTGAWWALAYMIFFGSVVPYLIFALAMTELTAARVAAFGYFQPLIATTFAVWMLHESLSARLFIGGALVLGGLYLTERERGDEPLAAVGENPPREGADSTSA